MTPTTTHLLLLRMKYDWIATDLYRYLFVLRWPQGGLQNGWNPSSVLTIVARIALLVLSAVYSARGSTLRPLAVWRGEINHPATKGRQSSLPYFQLSSFSRIEVPKCYWMFVSGSKHTRQDILSLSWIFQRGVSQIIWLFLCLTALALLLLSTDCNA